MSQSSFPHTHSLFQPDVSHHTHLSGFHKRDKSQSAGAIARLSRNSYGNRMLGPSKSALFFNRNNIKPQKNAMREFYIRNVQQNVLGLYTEEDLQDLLR